MSTAIKRWLGSLFALGLLVGGGGVVTGQEATPDINLGLSHPAHIHAGTCDSLGDVVFPLEEVRMPGQAGTPIAELPPIASPEAEGLLPDRPGESQTILDVSVDDILAGEHAINVHESAENIDNYIACGNITGEMTDGTLTFDLEELNDSGYSGQATLLDNGDDTTTVLITLIQDID